MDRESATPPRGILHIPAGTQLPGHFRKLAASPLRPFIEHYWVVRWELPRGARHVAETLPHPSSHWVTERGRSLVHGVPTGRFTRVIAGTGQAFGVKFRPGGLHPFVGIPAGEFTGRKLTLVEAFGVDGTGIGRELRALDRGSLTTDDPERVIEAMMASVDRFLLARLPAPDPQAELAARIAAAAAADRNIARVEDLVSRFGLTARALQRLFHRYVGVTPKWIIRRYRLLEAVERVAAGGPVQWSALAHSLGYYDQTHFIKDFRALIGRTPSAYARALKGDSPRR
ncbi:MAG: helix-turn-helix domain-containing protein [Gemmatimonadales bacterium]